MSSNPNFEVDNTVAFLSGINNDGIAFNFPTTFGTAGQILATDGAGNTSWIAASSGAVGTALSTPNTVMSRDASAITAVRGLKLDDPSASTARLQLNAASSGNWVATFPANAGTSGYVLTTDGGAPATLSWTVQDPGTSASTPSTVMARDGSGKTSVRGLYIDDSGGTNRIQILSAGSGATWNMTLPPNDGNLNDVLTTDGAGVCTWAPNLTGTPLSTPSTTASRDGSGFSAFRGINLDNGTAAIAVVLKADASTALWTMTLPVDDGGFGDLLTTDGAGVCTWTPQATASTASTVVARDVAGKTALKGLTLDSSGTVNLLPGGSGSWTFTLPTSGGTANYPLITNGSGVSSWTILPVAGGGTGAGTLTLNGVLYGNGTSAIGATAAGVSGQVLVGTTSNPPGWSYTLTLGSVGNIGTLSLAGDTSGVVTIAPQSTTSTYNFNLPTTAGSSGQPLTSGGGGAAPMTFTTLPVSGGGTGNTTLPLNQILLGNGTSAITQVAAVGATGQLLGGVSSSPPAWTYAPQIGASGNAGSIQLFNAAGNKVTLEPNTTISSNYTIRFPGSVGTSGQPLVGSVSGSTNTLSFATLGVSGGGTGLSSVTANSVLYGNGTSPFGLATSTTTGQVLQGNGSGSAPTWTSTPSLGSASGTGLIQFIGSTSGNVSLTVGSTTSTYTLTLPTTVGTAGSSLLTDASGNLSWGFPGTINPLTTVNIFDDFMNVSYGTTSITQDGFWGDVNWTYESTGGSVTSVANTTSFNGMGIAEFKCGTANSNKVNIYQPGPIYVGKGAVTINAWLRFTAALGTDKKFRFGLMTLVSNAFQTDPTDGIYFEFAAASSTSTIYGINRASSSSNTANIPSSTNSAISTTTLTISGVVTGTIVIGMYVFGAGISAGTYITAGSGTVWTVNQSNTVSGISMTYGFDPSIASGVGLQIVVNAGRTSVSFGVRSITGSYVTVDTVTTNIPTDTTLLAFGHQLQNTGAGSSDVGVDVDYYSLNVDLTTSRL